MDVSTVWKLKKESIAQYSSQSGDRDFWEPMLEGYHKHEHFIVQTKDKFSGWTGLVDQIVKID